MLYRAMGSEQEYGICDDMHSSAIKFNSLSPEFISKIKQCGTLKNSNIDQIISYLM